MCEAGEPISTISTFKIQVEITFTNTRRRLWQVSISSLHRYHISRGYATYALYLILFTIIIIEKLHSACQGTIMMVQNYRW